MRACIGGPAAIDRRHATARSLMTRSLSLWVATVATLFVPAVVAAQITIATLSGAIHDPSGAPIPGASITVINQETGAITHAVSDGEGGYRLALTPARYSLDV